MLTSILKTLIKKTKVKIIDEVNESIQFLKFQCNECGILKIKVTLVAYDIIIGKKNKRIRLQLFDIYPNTTLREGGGCRFN